MNMVKNKEVSIEGALHLAQKEVFAAKVRSLLWSILQDIRMYEHALESLDECQVHGSLGEVSPENRIRVEWTKNNIVDMLLISVVFQDSQHLLTGSQFNFSIYKYKHYRWQKRILQVTLKILTFEEIHKK